MSKYNHMQKVQQKTQTDAICTWIEIAVTIYTQVYITYGRDKHPGS